MDGPPFSNAESISHRSPNCCFGKVEQRLFQARRQVVSRRDASTVTVQADTTTDDLLEFSAP